MSSLLDILHRKDSRAERDRAADAAVDSAAQTVELRLAVDNGPLDEAPEVTMDGATANAVHLPPAASDPFATFAGPASHPVQADDATRVLMARQLKQRARRSTLWLGAGLALIVVGAGVATWLLRETSELTSGDDSLFTAPVDAAAFTPGTASGTVERPAAIAAPDEPATSPGRRELAAVPVRKPKAVEAADEDTAWFDTPAAEDPAGEPAAEPIRIVRGTTTNPLFARLSAAWTAFQAADYARAEALYREVRAAEPGNVDALLGLGALAARGQRTDEARELYEAVLLAEPKNATAISALATLPAAGSRQLDESALKNLLREQPGAANLHFALGLQYVTQGRWPDAQLAFFDAVRHEPTNADYAYNLAVSLDQLGQSAPAAAYYQRALELATASTLFNTGAAAERLAGLRAATP